MRGSQEPSSHGGDVQFANWLWHICETFWNTSGHTTTAGEKELPTTIWHCATVEETKLVFEWLGALMLECSLLVLSVLEPSLALANQSEPKINMIDDDWKICCSQRGACSGRSGSHGFPLWGYYRSHSSSTQAHSRSKWSKIFQRNLLIFIAFSDLATGSNFMMEPLDCKSGFIFLLTLRQLKAWGLCRFKIM